VLIKYHLIWIPRRRRKVLVGAIADRLEQLLQEKCAELEIVIEHLEIQPDHLPGSFFRSDAEGARRLGQALQ
jgi:putative transposase